MKIIIETISTTRKKTEALLKEQKGRGCNLQGIWLYKEDLKGVDLRGANLQGADLRDADFRGAKLHGAVIDERVAQHIEALQMIEFEEARILMGLKVKISEIISENWIFAHGRIPKCGIFVKK